MRSYLIRMRDKQTDELVVEQWYENRLKRDLMYKYYLENSRYAVSTEDFDDQ